jgi:uncharacterized protein (DUF1330 family)
MSAYLSSLCIQVTDRTRLEAYWSNVAPAFKSIKAKPLAAYTPFEVLEGDSGVRGVVLFEFSSMEEAAAPLMIVTLAVPPPLPCLRYAPVHW